MQGQLGQGCKITRRGPITVAGLSGKYFSVSCPENGSEWSEMFAAASGPGVMVVLNTAAPSSSLQSVELTFGGIEHSITLGDGKTHTQWIGGDGQVSQTGSDNARQLAALKKACDIGAMPPDECQQRMASLNAQPSPQPQAPAHAHIQTLGEAEQRGRSASNDPNFNPNDPDYDPYARHSNPNSTAPSNSGAYAPAPAPSRTGVYRDSQGRYSLTVPDGWTATPANDTSGTLNLKNGPSWATVTLMTWAGDNAAEPKDIVMGIANDMAPNYQNVKLAGEGDFPANGHPAHGLNATGIDSNGVEVVVAIISVQMRGPNFLSVVTSTPIEQANPVNEQIMKMVRSVRYGGE